MLLITRLYIRFWKRRRRPPCFILSDGHLLVRRTAIPAAPMPLPRWCDFAERTLWNVRRGPALLRLDVGRPDDRPPLIDLRLVVGIERLRRLLFARRKLHADVPEAPWRGGVGEGGRDRGVESGDDRLGRALGRPHPVPERKVHAGRARLVDRRHVGSRKEALLSHDCKDPKLAGAVVCQRLPGLE